MKHFHAATLMIFAVTFSPLTLSEKFGAYNTATKIALSSPEDVGRGHSKIIHDLQIRFQKKLPNNDAEYLKAIYMVVSDSICDLDDVRCYYRVAKRTNDSRKNTFKGYDPYTHIQTLLPTDFDVEALKSMKKLLSTTAKLDEVKDAIYIMEQDKKNLQNNKEVTNESHRDIVIVAYSVGMESAKQWAEILRNPDDPFNKMINDDRPFNRKSRRLQFDGLDSSQLTEGFFEVLQGDIVGSVDGALEGLFEPDLGLSSALEAAAVASLKAFLETFTDGGDNDTGGIINCALFPNSPLCNDDNDFCFFSFGPGCDEVGTSDDEVGTSDDEVNEDDYCPFPSLANCGVSINDDNSGFNSDDANGEGILCENFPQFPQCQGNGDNDGFFGNLPEFPEFPQGPESSQDDIDAGEESNEQVEPINALCEQYPNLPCDQICDYFPNRPQCNPNSIDSDNSQNVGTLCDQFPNNIFCQ